jgi:hypothetical protein
MVFGEDAQSADTLAGRRRISERLFRVIERGRIDKRTVMIMDVALDRRKAEQHAVAPWGFGTRERLADRVGAATFCVSFSHEMPTPLHLFSAGHDHTRPTVGLINCAYAACHGRVCLPPLSIYRMYSSA